jgi:hypothetical protein
MAVTANSLKAAGFRPYDHVTFCFGCFDYEFRIPTQELYFTNDGFGEPELLGRYTDIEELLLALEAVSGLTREEL